MPPLWLNEAPECFPALLQRVHRRTQGIVSPESCVPALLHAFRDTFAFRLDPIALARVKAIERVRRLNEQSRQPIVRIDYGAGDPHTGRTPAEMAAGVTVKDVHGEVCRSVSKPLFWCVLLFLLIRRFRPRSCIEMGTAFGISAAYQQAALALNGTGTLITLEGSAALAEIARANFTSLEWDGPEVIVGRFADTLEPALRRARPVDFVFVDGHHDEAATRHYFEQILPHLTDRALLVFDDIAWSDGMKRVWKSIGEDPRVTASFDLGPLGLCLIDRPFRKRRHYVRPLWADEQHWLAQHQPRIHESS